MNPRSCPALGFRVWRDHPKRGSLLHSSVLCRSAASEPHLPTASPVSLGWVSLYPPSAFLAKSLLLFFKIIYATA